MESIPVTFECDGRNYIGLLCQVAGAGGTAVFHLMDNRNFYCGRLRYSDFTKGWVFDGTPKTLALERQADYLGDVVIAWYQ
jgi:hypothetical protein